MDKGVSVNCGPGGRSEVSAGEAGPEGEQARPGNGLEVD